MRARSNVTYVRQRLTQILLILALLVVGAPVVFAQWHMHGTIPDSRGDVHWDEDRGSVYTFGRSYNSFRSLDSGVTWEIMPMKGLELFASQNIVSTDLADNGGMYLRATFYGVAKLAFVSHDGGNSFTRLVKDPTQAQDPTNNDYDYGFSRAHLSVVQPNRVFLRSPMLEPQTVYWTEDDGSTFRVERPAQRLENLNRPTILEVTRGVAAIPTWDHWSILPAGQYDLQPTTVPTTIDNWTQTPSGTFLGHTWNFRIYYKNRKDTSYQVLSQAGPNGILDHTGTFARYVHDSLLAAVTTKGAVFFMSDSDTVPRLVFDPGLTSTRQLIWTEILPIGVGVRYEIPTAPQDRRVHTVLIDPEGKVVAHSRAPGRSTTGGTLSYEASRHWFRPITSHRWVHQQWTSTDAGGTWWALRRTEQVDSVFNPYAYELIGVEPDGSVLFADAEHQDLYRLRGDTTFYISPNAAPVTYARSPGSRSNPDLTLMFIEGVPQIVAVPDGYLIGGNAVSRWSRDFRLIDTALKKRCLAIDVGTNGLAFAGTDTLYRSTDGGRIWHTRLSVKDLTATSALYTKIKDIAHSSRDTVVIGLAGCIQVRGYDTTLVSLGGLWSSTDGGVHWTRGTGVDSARNVLQVESLGNGEFIAITCTNKFSQNLDSVLSAATIYYENTTIVRSVDGGRTWSEVMSTRESMDVRRSYGQSSSLTVVGDSIWFAHPETGLFLSEDRGMTFWPIKATVDIDITSVVPFEGSSILVGGKGGVYRLDDPQPDRTTGVAGAAMPSRQLDWQGSAVHVHPAYIGGTLTVFDLAGRSVYAAESIARDVDLSHLAPGAYVVVITDPTMRQRTSGAVLRP